ncbi:MAG: FkbM family methyltransferase [Pseudomonadota bacterium]
MATKTQTKPHAENEYGRYFVPAGLEDRPASKAVLAGNVYEADTIKFMRAHAGDGDIIHAGTFFGDFLPGLSSAMAKGAKVWAFEPNPDSYAAAKKTVSLNKLKNIDLQNVALSNVAGNLLFKSRDGDGNSIGGISHIVDEPGEGVHEVSADLLDYIVPRDRHVSILQLDVEDHEKHALRGAFHLIQRCRPILILEYLSNERWLQRTFRGMGYEQRGKIHSNWVYATPDTETVI